MTEYLRNSKEYTDTILEQMNLSRLQDISQYKKSIVFLYASHKEKETIKRNQE